MRKFMGNYIHVLSVLRGFVSGTPRPSENAKNVILIDQFRRTLDIKLGVAKVKTGFSIPPYGKLGGKMSTLYSPQTYG
jgi:hypothetical protein